MYPETYSPYIDRTGEDRSKRKREGPFRCKKCGSEVSTDAWQAGVHNRNHCPYCLSSRHVDLYHPGDRMSACKALMLPIGLTVKRKENKYGGQRAGELMLIHLCSDCGKLSINRIAADDLEERLMEIYRRSFSMDEQLRRLLNASGILLLQAIDCGLVTSQLHVDCRI
jgi:DNA-directed RNA polymerase subunit RPC12/RpoP